MIRHKHLRETGYSYMEVVLCIALIGIVVGPIFKLLATSSKVRNEAKSLYKVTYYAQNMMEQLKEILPIYLASEVSNNYLPEDERVYVEEIKMLMEGTGEEVEEAISFLGVKDREKFSADYELDKYIYDIGIWQVTDESKEQLLQAVPIYQMTKLSTKKAEEALDYEEVLAQMVVEEELQFNTQTPYSLFGTSYKPEESLRGRCLITWQKESQGVRSVLRDSEGAVQEKVALLNTEDKGQIEKIEQEGRDIYEITTHEPGRIGEVKIKVDLTRAGDLSADKLEDIKIRPITVQNKTGYNLVIELAFDSQLSSEWQEALVEQLIKVNNPNRTLMMIQDGENKAKKNHLIMVILVRKKGPALGEKGKVIKKMIDIY